MKLIVKIILGVLILVILGFAGMISYVKFGLPKVADAPDLQVEITAERLERGEYLANNVSGCIECHSMRDWNTLAGPVVEGTEGSGGVPYTPEMKIPGTIYPTNITPVGLEEWTDGELFRAITSGVSRDGTSLFPVMPYHEFGKMDKEDIYSIIAYMRTLEPKGENVPERQLDFPMGLIVNLMPRQAEFSVRPDTTDWVAYGEYMATAGGCISCHTLADEKGIPVPGMHLSGGYEFPMPGNGIVRSSNLSPDMETGIGGWTEEVWLARITAFADDSLQLPEVKPGEFNTVMPWLTHGKMSERDLRAIFRYIRTQEPVSNRVERFTPETKDS
jgi:mono/diheme cytochrome c family protein